MTTPGASKFSSFRVSPDRVSTVAFHCYIENNCPNNSDIKIPPSRPGETVRVGRFLPPES